MSDEVELKVGDTVKSEAVGSKESFVGTITRVYQSGKLEAYYHVRDAYNFHWHRDDSELTLVLAF